jgi:hypothetical protein
LFALPLVVYYDENWDKGTIRPTKKNTENGKQEI